MFWWKTRCVQFSTTCKKKGMKKKFSHTKKENWKRERRKKTCIHYRALKVSQSEPCQLFPHPCFFLGKERKKKEKKGGVGEKLWKQTTNSPHNQNTHTNFAFSPPSSFPRFFVQEKKNDRKEGKIVKRRRKKKSASVEVKKKILSFIIGQLLAGCGLAFAACEVAGVAFLGHLIGPKGSGPAANRAH